MRRFASSVVIACLLVACGGEVSETNTPTVPLPSRSPDTIGFCVEMQKMRTDAGMLVTLIVTGDPFVEEVAQRLWESVELGAVVVPDEIRDQYLAVRTTGLRIKALLEEASYDINEIAAVEGEVTGLLNEVLDELAGPIFEWSIEGCRPDQS